MPVLLGAIEVKTAAQAHPRPHTQCEECMQISWWESGLIHQPIFAGQRSAPQDDHASDALLGVAKLRQPLGLAAPVRHHLHEQL